MLLGQRGLNELDEGRYAEIAREMTVTGEWPVPHLNGNPHFQKPPVVYWLTALSCGTFGNHQWRGAPAFGARCTGHRGAVLPALAASVQGS